jgi:hypothetical protein
MSDEKKSGSKVIVSFDQLNSAMRKTESAAKTEEEAESVASTPEEKAAMLVAINRAMEELEIASQGRDKDVLVSPDHRVASLLQSYVARQSMEAEKVEPAGPGGKYLEAKFDDKDYISWVGSFFHWWKGLVNHPWLNTPSNDEFGQNTRVALLGDWGTGMYGAPVCSQSIEDDKDGYPVRLHLGDVYYSGDTEEVQERFLAIWPENKTGNEINRACNSNHEMYTGGHAYFNYTLSKFKQSASYFALHNDNWILAGLDTAYKAKTVTDDQVTWLTDLVANAEGRRVILLSHHQPFSFYEGGHPYIVQKLSALLDGQKIFAWYWGHEHRCVLYDKHPGWNMHGRCVGHSGYPYFRDKVDAFSMEATNENGVEWRRLPSKDGQGSDFAPSSLLIDGENSYMDDKDIPRYGIQGYMTLHFDGPRLFEQVHSPDGRILYDRELA